MTAQLLQHSTAAQYIMVTATESTTGKIVAHLKSYQWREIALDQYHPHKGLIIPTVLFAMALPKCVILQNYKKHLNTSPANSNRLNWYTELAIFVQISQCPTKPDSIYSTNGWNG